jgi:ubiquinone/menaquinone biosynthesis C-methylase UbiE
LDVGRQLPSGADTRSRYRRVAPIYDLLDLPFEYARYRPLRRILCAGLSGHILDAGVGTGRNIPFYPPEAIVTGIDLSPEMLARAERRKAGAGVAVELLERDVRDTGFPDATFDAVIASFLFCVLPDADQLPALRELARVCKPNGEVRLLEYVRPRRGFRRFLTRLWEPWVGWAYGASFERDIERHMAGAGFVLVEARFVVDELIQYLVARRRGDEGPAPARPIIAPRAAS